MNTKEKKERKKKEDVSSFLLNKRKDLLVWSLNRTNPTHHLKRQGETQKKRICTHQINNSVHTQESSHLPRSVNLPFSFELHAYNNYDSSIVCRAQKKNAEEKKKEKEKRNLLIHWNNHKIIIFSSYICVCI